MKAVKSNTLDIKAVILAGGKGTRLWPLSRENYPKQFVEFINGSSLFQLTLRRLLHCFSSKNIYTVTSDIYRFHTVNQIDLLKDISPVTRRNLKTNIILEPYPKSTAPAVLLVLKVLEKKLSQNDILFVFPSDHIITPLSSFKKMITDASSLAQKDFITIVGIKPTGAREGFGYVLVGEKVDKGFYVKKFVEKPNARRLKYLMKQKSYWNAGIFAFRPSVFLRELSKFAPRIYRHYEKSLPRLLLEFKKIPGDSIDYAIMQKTKSAALVEFTGRWSDLGSWESVYEYFSQSEKNFNIGKAEFLKSHRCFSFSVDKLVSFLEVNDVILVESSDSILVMRKGASDKVKELIANLRNKKAREVESGLTVYRPWGYYTILKEKPNYKVKEIAIYPGKYISLQRHRYRSEHWNVVRGKAKVIVGKRKVTISSNQSIYVPKGVKHRIYNPTRQVVVIIEVQIGTYLGEDDILRYDSYQ